MNPFLIGASGARSVQPGRSTASTVFKSTLLGVCVLAGAGAAFAQVQFSVDNGISNQLGTYTNVIVGDTTSETSLTIPADISVRASGMFRLGREADDCTLTITGSLEITGTGHLCLGGFSGSANIATISGGGTVITPKVHIGGMNPTSTTSPTTNDNSVIVTGSGSELLIGSDDLKIAYPNSGLSSLPATGNNLTVVSSGKVIIAGDILVSSHAVSGVKQNYIDVDSTAILELVGTGRSSELTALVTGGYLRYNGTVDTTLANYSIGDVGANTRLTHN